MSDSYTIFYSWQSDTEAETNRNLIEKALEGAIIELNSDVSLDVNLSLEQDVRDHGGMVSIADTVFSKIRKSDVFVADFTFVGSTQQRIDGTRPMKHLLNPNVLIETGYAACAIGWERIVGVINTAFGPLEGLPFDMRHRHCPVNYHLAEQAKVDQELLDELANQLASQIRIILNKIIESKNRHVQIETNESLEEASGKIKEFHSNLQKGNFQNMDVNKGLLALAIVPAAKENILLEGDSIEKLLRTHLQPIWCGSYDYGRTGSSFFTFCQEENNPESATVINLDGSIFAANRVLHTQGTLSDDQCEIQGITSVMPLWDIESTLVRHTTSYLTLARELNVYGPYQLSIALFNLGPTVLQMDLRHYRTYEARVFKKTHIIPPTITIPPLTSEPDEFSTALNLKKIFDYIWREFNMPGSPHYTIDGKWRSD